MDNDILISEVFKRKALWDIGCKEHSRRDLVKMLWDEVAKTLNTNRETVKRCWKSLRDNYRAELRKIKEKPKSGSAASSVRHTKWAFFDSMDFLRDVVSPGSLQGNLADIEPVEISISENTNAKSQDVNEGTQEVEDISKENHNQEADITIIKEGQDPKPAKTTRKRKTNMEENAFIQLEKEKLKILKDNYELKNDSDYNFLISFVPHMKKMSDVNNLKFRMEISRILLEIKKEELGSAESTTPVPSTSWENTQSPYEDEQFVHTFENL